MTPLRKLGLQDGDQHRLRVCRSAAVFSIVLFVKKAQLDPGALRARVQSSPGGFRNTLGKARPDVGGNGPDKLDIKNRHDNLR